MPRLLKNGRPVWGVYYPWCNIDLTEKQKKGIPRGTYLFAYEDMYYIVDESCELSNCMAYANDLSSIREMLANGGLV